MAVTLRAAGTVATGTTSLAISSPASAVNGDYLLAFTIDHATSGSTTAPTGWTRIGGVAGTGCRFQVFSAVVGSGSLTGTSWSWTSLTTRAEGVICAFYGQNAVPLDGTLTARLNASGTTGTTAVTTVYAGDLVVGAFAALAAASTWSAETTATAGALSEVFNAGYSTYCRLAVATLTQAAAGSTGASSATMGTAGANAGILLAIKSSPASATVTMASALAVTTTKPVPALPETSPSLEVSGFTIGEPGSTDTIEWVQAAVTEHQSSALVAPCTIELWDYSGTPAIIGIAQAGTASTSLSNVSTARFTGVTYGMLATLRVRVYGHSGTATAGATESVDGVTLTVCYSPAASLGHVYAGVKAVTTAVPVPVVRQDVTITPTVLAVTTTQPLVIVTTTVQPYGTITGGPWALAFSDEFTDPHSTGQPDWTVWADHLPNGDGWRSNNTGTEIRLVPARSPGHHHLRWCPHPDGPARVTDRRGPVVPHPAAVREHRHLHLCDPPISSGFPVRPRVHRSAHPEHHDARRVVARVLDADRRQQLASRSRHRRVQHGRQRQYPRRVSHRRRNLA